VFEAPTVREAIAGANLTQILTIPGVSAGQRVSQEFDGTEDNAKFFIVEAVYQDRKVSDFSYCTRSVVFLGLNYTCMV